jgi:hypothetical protein
VVTIYNTFFNILNLCISPIVYMAVISFSENKAAIILVMSINRMVFVIAVLFFKVQSERLNIVTR